MNESGAINREKLVESLIQTISGGRSILEKMNNFVGIIAFIIANHLIENDIPTKKIY